MEEYEYAHIPLNVIPEEIIKQYNLLKIEVNDKLYFEVRRGMLGLKQAGITDHERLSNHLKAAGYILYRFTPSLWTHKHYLLVLN